MQYWQQDRAAKHLSVATKYLSDKLSFHLLSRCFDSCRAQGLLAVVPPEYVAYLLLLLFSFHHLQHTSISLTPNTLPIHE